MSGGYPAPQRRGRASPRPMLIAFGALYSVRAGQVPRPDAGPQAVGALVRARDRGVVVAERSSTVTGPKISFARRARRPARILEQRRREEVPAVERRVDAALHTSAVLCGHEGAELRLGVERVGDRQLEVGVAELHHRRRQRAAGGRFSVASSLAQRSGPPRPGRPSPTGSAGAAPAWCAAISSPPMISPWLPAGAAGVRPASVSGVMPWCSCPPWSVPRGSSPPAAGAGCSRGRAGRPARRPR